MIQEYTTDIHSGPSGNYKLGFSATPDKRVSDLRGGNCRSLDFKHKSQVKSEKAARDAEAEMHSTLDKYRIKNRKLAGTEWFAVDQDHFAAFEHTYLDIANKYKSENLSHLDEVMFKKHSMEEAAKENERAMRD